MKVAAWILLTIALPGLLVLGFVSADTIHDQFFSGSPQTWKNEFFNRCKQDAIKGNGSLESCVIASEMAAQDYQRGQRLFLLTVLIITGFHLLHSIALIKFLTTESLRALRISALWSVVPGASPGVILGIPIGIWALISLRKKSD
ncbi:MAG: hypothetical protein RH862_03720 [Leptospiraceae bacterium]